MLDTGAGIGAPAGGTRGAAQAAAATHRPTGTTATPPEEDPVPPGGATFPPWDLVTVPALHGLEAVDILRLRDGVGPVLHDRAGDTLGFLVPPGTADCWDLPGSACTQTFAHARAAAAEPPVAGAGWLVPPEGAYVRATEPAELRAALGEAARTIAAAGRHL